ncbi:MAG: MBL fold metallo-hydrolase [Cocleimonas sp.]|nr:MBL fold metallo-hydrolase [Cocleimonas sp.]
MKFDLHVLKAMSGDSLLLSYIGNDNKEHNLLIDGGKPNTYKNSIKKIINNIELLDYVFITHIDNDHIGGVLKLLGSNSSDKVKNIFFNSGHFISKNNTTSVSETDANNLIDFINQSSVIKANKKEISINTEYDFFGLKISFLSPSYDAITNFNNSYCIKKIKPEALISDSVEEANSLSLDQLSKIKFREKSLKSDPANGVSLAMLVEYQNKSILLLGDAKDSIIISSLKKTHSVKNKLKVDYIKLSHHGSKFHTNNDFLSLIECSKFIISTDGKHSGNKHPNIETIARILCHKYRDKRNKIYFYFNYPENTYIDNGTRLLSKKEKIKHNCECWYNKNIFEIGSL